MDIQDWSTTAGSNTDVDGTSIAEGMDPGLVNNAMRAIMANVAAYIALSGGAKVSGGTADVQTLTSGLSLTAYQQGLMIAFEAGSGLTNTGAMTMNVDGIAAKSVKQVDGSDPPAGAVTAGGIYLLAYESAADVLLLLNPTPAAVDPDTLKADVGDDLTAGFTSDDYARGTVTTGTETPAPGTGEENYQTLTNNGAFTLAPPANSCSVVIHVTNAGSAGAITTSGFTLVDGDPYVTTDTYEFLFYITKISDVSHLTIKALQ